MVNTTSKGRRSQKNCKDILELEGWTVDYCGKQSRYGHDLFGLFDLLALKKGQLKCVQVTTNRPHTHRAYMTFETSFGPWAEIQVEQWVWKDRIGFTVYVYKDGSYTKALL
jgi:hypothetical protein